MKDIVISAWWCLLAAPLLPGCGPSLPERGVVTGTIKVDGQPINQGQVCFWPDQGRPATGTIQADGTYRLTTFEPGDGAILGKHRVTVEAKRVVGKGKMPTSMEEEIAMIGSGQNSARDFKLHWLAPERYRVKETSGLIAEVKSGENQLDFDLKSQP